MGFYIFVGVSLLAKGLVGIVLPFGVVVAYYLFRRSLPDRKICFTMLWGIPLALAVASVWYAPVINRHGWLFIDQFFIQHHFTRYLSNKYRHYQPVYYYLLILPLLCLPWTFFLLSGLRNTMRSLGHRRPNRKEMRQTDREEEAVTAEDLTNKLLMFASVWLLVPLVFFSFSSSKLPGYILPALPAAALITAERLTRLRELRNRHGAETVTAALFLLAAIAAPLYAARSAELSMSSALMIGGPLAVAGGFALLSLRRTTSMLLLGSATLFAMFVAINWVAPGQAERDTSKRLIEQATAKGYSQALIFGMQRADRTPEFYAVGRIVYGPDGEPVFYDNAQPVIDESRKRNQAVLVFVPVQDVSLWRGYQSAQTEVVGDNGRFALLAVRAR